MKKTLLILVLVVALLTSTVCAYTVQDNNTADALNDLGLFQGMGGTKGYALDESLTRGQGITLLVRMIGKEAEATNSTYTNSFTDASWAAPYIGYAFANGITNGMSETKFGTDVPMTDYMFLTLTLRALGYTDSGAAPQFTWDKPYDLAYELGMIAAARADSAFTRADAIRVFWNAMNVNFNGKTETLADSLIAQGVFTAAEFAEAQQTQQSGRKTEEQPKQEKTEQEQPDTPSRDDSGEISEPDSMIGKDTVPPTSSKPSGTVNHENETEMDYAD